MSEDKKKDWKGNSKSTYSMLGASNHSDNIRELNDFYATDPTAVEELLKNEEFSKNILEPCCGMGHISKVLINKGYNVTSSDLIDRGFGKVGVDFITGYDKFDGDIITNPPYRYVSDFVLKALSIIPTGNKVAMLLKMQTLESQERYDKIFSKYPPKEILVFVKRTLCAMNGDFNKYKSSAACYAWFIWEKGFNGSPIIKWINFQKDNEKTSDSLSELLGGEE